MVYDESTFHANDDQMRMWGEPDTHMIRLKSRGAGLMISAFIEEFDCFLRPSDEQYDNNAEKPSKKAAREMLHYGAEREGYWDNMKFMVGHMKQIARKKYPSEKYNIFGYLTRAVVTLQ